MNYGDPWLIIELHDYVFPFWHAILQPVLTITMNKMRKNETQLMNGPRPTKDKSHDILQISWH